LEDLTSEDVPAQGEEVVQEEEISQEVQAEEHEEVQAEEYEEIQTEEHEEVQEEYEEVAITLDDKEKTPVNLLTYYQFSKILEIASRDYQLDESLWKHLDKLEDYVRSVDASYRIHSKLWNRIEKYVAIYLNCGGDPHEALDSVLANHIIGEMLHSVANVKLNEKFSNTLENIFGEGQVPHSIKVVKSTNAKI
ncbi:MAG: hypothetical protein J6Q38_01730, partial [Clostridia bacterium]|nr:hypothetical protein [Clostridia bacterium]